MKSLLPGLVIAATPAFAAHAAQQNSHVEVMQLAASKATVASSRALAGFQNYADQLVDTYMRNGTCDDNNTRSAVITIIDYINDLHLGNLAQHNADLGLLGSCAAGIASCNTQWFSSTSRSHIANLSVLINRTRDAHKVCRDEQDDCCEALDVGIALYSPWSPTAGLDPPNTSSMNASCKIYDAYRGEDIQAIWSNDLEDCFNEQSLLTDHLATEDQATRVDMEKCLTHFHDWHKPLYDLYVPCKRGKDCCEDVHGKCEELQQDFETIHCIGYDYINDHCEGYDHCWDAEEARCSGFVCTDIAADVEIRKAENETGMRIICLLEVLINVSDEHKKAELDACKAKTYIEEQAFWDITCPTSDFPPPRDPGIVEICQGTPVRTPCDFDFRTTEYGGQDWSTGGTLLCKFVCPNTYDDLTQRNESFVVHADKTVDEQFGGHAAEEADIGITYFR